MADPVRVVGLGGSLRPGSTSLGALRIALDGVAAAGGEPHLIPISELGLPLYAPTTSVPAAARDFAAAVYHADALLWSSPTYHGAVSGAFKNAIDWLILLVEKDPPYLTNKPVGLIATAGGVQGLQAVNTMEFIARALRAWSVPMMLPVAHSWQAFDSGGRLLDEAIAAQLRGLGAEVVRAARQFHADGTCDYADERQFATP